MCDVRTVTTLSLVGLSAINIGKTIATTMESPYLRLILPVFELSVLSTVRTISS